MGTLPYTGVTCVTGVLDWELVLEVLSFAETRVMIDCKRLSATLSLLLTRQACQAVRVLPPRCHEATAAINTHQHVTIG